MIIIQLQQHKTTNPQGHKLVINIYYYYNYNPLSQQASLKSIKHLMNIAVWYCGLR